MTTLVGTAEVAERFGLSERSARLYASRGLLPAFRIGERGRWRFVEEELDAIVDQARGTRERAVEPVAAGRTAEPARAETSRAGLRAQEVT
jgi:Helix-turn-helix domain